MPSPKVCSTVLRHDISFGCWSVQNTCCSVVHENIVISYGSATDRDFSHRDRPGIGHRGGARARGVTAGGERLAGKARETTRLRSVPAGRAPPGGDAGGTAAAFGGKSSARRVRAVGEGGGRNRRRPAPYADGRDQPGARDLLASRGRGGVSPGSPAGPAALPHPQLGRGTRACRPVGVRSRPCRGAVRERRTGAAPLCDPARGGAAACASSGR